MQSGINIMAVLAILAGLALMFFGPEVVDPETGAAVKEHSDIALALLVGGFGAGGVNMAIASSKSNNYGE